MGSSGEGDIDCSVGTIVWVRRRNGSWWPGKILGPEELSASHVMSPRSGTPVKLLGREDASVDWYNLEKSKRVKAFRCGDFDDCIERAESSLGVPSKKREKYARREDAILHALELEKEMLGDKHDKSGITSDCRSRKLSDANREEFIISSETLGNENGKLRNFKSHEISKSLDLCLKDEVMGEAQLARQAEEGNQVSYEDEISNVIPRMRGLQDFEHKATPSKRKISSPAVSNGYQKPREDTLVVSIGGFNVGSSSYASSFLEKRKTLYKGLNEDSPVKRRDRCRPLVQVLKTSAKLPASLSMQTDSGSVYASVPGDEQTRVTCQAKRSKCLYLPPKSSDCLDQKENSSIQVEVSSSQIEANNCHPHPSSLTEGNSSESTEDDKADSSETDYLESDTEDEMFVASDSAGPLEAEPKTMGISELEVEQGSVSSDGLGERAGDMSPLHPHGAVSGDGGMSEWQLKGKRNIRSFTKRYVDSYDGRGSHVSTHGIYLEEKGSSFSLHPKSDDFGSGFDDPDVIDSYYNTQAVGFSGRGYPLTSKAASRRRSSGGHDIVDLDESAWDNRPALKNYWEEKHECFNPVFIGRRHLGSRTKSMLIDVDLKVQSSYPKEHVPIVSLMSRFNGKAIIGHPIQIEALEDGLSAGLLPRNDDFGNEAFDNDMNTALTPVWRTARRTANRVRRPHPSSMWDDEDDAEQVPFDKGKKSQFKKLNAGTTSQKASRMRTAPHIPRPPTQRKATRKPPKKASLSASQKIRTLSSIAVGNKPKHGSRSNYLEGLIKPVSGPTTVACIPVKLVFSRLFEGVVRPPSRVAGHGDTTIGNTGRKPS